MEERIKTLEQKAEHDALAIGAIRHVLMNHFGPQAAQELEAEVNNLLMGWRKPTQ
jgi:hypothetical protein